MMNFMWYWWSILSISSYIHPIIGITQVLGPPADSSHLKCGSDRGFEPGNGRKEWWWWGMDGGFLEFQDVSNFQQHSIKPLCVENRVFDITTRNMEVPTYNLYFSWLRQPMAVVSSMARNIVHQWELHLQNIVDLPGTYLICFHIVPGPLSQIEQKTQGIGSTTASRMVNLLCLGTEGYCPWKRCPKKDQKRKWLFFNKHHGWSGNLLGVGGLPHFVLKLK